MSKFKVGDIIYLTKELYVLSSDVKLNDTFVIEDIDDNLVQLRYLKKDINQYIKPSHFDHFELVNYKEKYAGDNE